MYLVEIKGGYWSYIGYVYLFFSGEGGFGVFDRGVVKAFVVGS